MESGTAQINLTGWTCTKCGQFVLDGQFHSCHTSAEPITNWSYDTMPVFHGHPDFYKILDDIRELHSKKNHDYAGDDPLSNLKVCDQFGIEPWIGVLVRISDKWSRIMRYAEADVMEVNDETVEDTLMDMAVYAILAIILFRERSRDGIGGKV